MRKKMEISEQLFKKKNVYPAILLVNPDVTRIKQNLDLYRTKKFGPFIAVYGITDNFEFMGIQKTDAVFSNDLHECWKQMMTKGKYFRYFSLKQMILHMIPNRKEDFSKVFPELYVVTTNYSGAGIPSYGGASVLLFPNILKKMEKIVGENYYIIPSSIHEIIIIQNDTESETKEVLNFMLNSVNQSEVRPEERLCDNVFTLNQWLDILMNSR